MTQEHLERILDELVLGRVNDPKLKLYALVDAASNKAIFPRLNECPHKKSCLYKGAPPKLERAAPWLVAVEEGNGAFVEWLVDEGWGNNWAIYLLTNASLGELRKHFRRFLQVYRTDGRKLYFRFSDPRVLRGYLPTCTKEELDFVFGPTSEFLIAGNDPSALFRLTLDEEEGLNREVVSFAPPVAPPVEPEAEAEAQAAPAEDVPPEIAALLAEVQKPGGGAQDIERIRDALAAAPGQAALLEYLGQLGSQRFAEACLGAAPLRDILGDLASTEFPPSALDTALRSFSEKGSWKAVFVALAPQLDRWLPAADRAKLAQSCQVLIDLTAFAETTRIQRTRLRGAQELRVPREEKRAVNSALAALKTMRDKAVGWTTPEDDPKVGKARKGIVRLVQRVEGRSDPSARSLVSGMTSLLVSLGAHGGHDDNEVGRVARGVITALASTTPPNGEVIEAATPVAIEPAVRERRYTMRRKALPAVPFERDRLVIRDEQMLALAESMQRALAVRLTAGVGEKHAETYEELGVDRVRAIVELALEKASDHRIQRVGAIEILLDLMITIDPEFMELEEYAWAKDLLENTMLEPNAKPALIRDELED